MRWVFSFLLASGLVCASASSAFAAPANSGVHPTAVDSATWLVHQVGPGGFIPQAADPTKPNLSASIQAVTALASVKAYRSTAQTLLSYVNAHVDDFVVHGGVDDPGSLAYVILADRALGVNPSALVTRLLATQQPTGLFGAADASFDGAFRQGLSLLALAASSTNNAAGVTWLEGQQCADDLWMALRDTPNQCPAVDPNTFSGPDTNSTALAMLGLFAQGAMGPAHDGATALDAVRNSGGGWGFLAASDQSTDANSTGLVLQALRTVNGSADAQGTAALAALVVGCTGDPADIGGIAFQPGAGGALVPDAFATVQALPGLAGVALPLVAVSFSTATPPAACTVSTAPATTTPVSNAGGSSSTTAATVAAAAELPRTGSAAFPVAAFGVLLIGAGVGFVGGARRRRA